MKNLYKLFAIESNTRFLSESVWSLRSLQPTLCVHFFSRHSTLFDSNMTQITETIEIIDN